MNKKKKKIRLVHVISSLKIGGAEALLIDLIRTLGTARYEHHVIYFHRGIYEKHLTQLGIAIHHIEGLVLRYDLIFFVRLYKIFRYIKPDVIHSSLWVANFCARILGKLLRIPTVCAIHLGVDSDGVLRNLLDQHTLWLADTVVAISDSVAQSLYSRPTWIKPTNISLVKNGIDKERVITLKFEHQQQREQYGFHKNDIVLGSVGRLISRKNFSLLLEVFAELSKKRHDIRLVLIGQGPEEKRLRFLAKNLKIDHLVTFITGQIAYGYYSLIDIFVLPSFQEGLSIALLEAMSCGLPCVVSSATGSGVVDNYHNGIVVLSEKKEEFVQSINDLIHDVSLRVRLGCNAQKTVEKSFSIKTMARTYGQIYEKMNILYNKTI